jgi:hypothetical protein
LGRGVLSFGISALMTDDDVPDFNDVGRPVRFDYGEYVYNDGPELELYAKLTALRFQMVALEAAGGISIQQQAHVARPPFTGGLRTLDVEVVPNGYTTHRRYMTGYLGVGLQLGRVTLSLGQHTRRGWVVGLGLSF